MPPKTTKETQALAQQIVRTLYLATDGRPGQWRMLSGFRGATEDAWLYAKERGWIELEGDHSVRLTDNGRGMAAKQAH
jgi:hypothetical protein